MRREDSTQANYEGLFERLFKGNRHTARENRVREYIVHRVRGGARLGEVLKEGYVRRNCDQDELDDIVRDPRLIHAEREEFERFFEDGRIDSALSTRRR